MNIGKLEAMIDEGKFEEALKFLVSLQNQVYKLKLRTRRIMERHPEYDSGAGLKLMSIANNMGMP